MDTISKQYQVDSARVSGTHPGAMRDSRTQDRRTQDRSTQGSGQDDSDGGGAPWES
ncbi:hypothetical protein ACVV2G_07840 [Streptomyces ziwulingensis]